MKCDFTEKTISSEIVYAGEFIQVKRDSSLLIDGSEAKRENVVHPGAAMILPLFGDRSISLRFFILATLFLSPFLLGIFPKLRDALLNIFFFRINKAFLSVRPFDVPIS